MTKKKKYFDNIGPWTAFWVTRRTLVVLGRAGRRQVRQVGRTDCVEVLEVRCLINGDLTWAELVERIPLREVSLQKKIKC
jgi:hypothetical protein